MADDLLKEALDAFQQASDAESENRSEALDDLRFARLAEQWHEHDRKRRELENRPCLTINRMPAFIRQVVNDARQNKPAIKVHPADDGADPETAEVVNGIIRNIEYTSDAEVAYDTALESAVTGGFGYFRIATEYAHDDTFDLDLRIQRIANPFSVYGDPHSQAADSSDWSTAFVTEMMRKEEFEARYKGAAKVDWDALGYSALQQPWAEDESVLVAEWWKREEVAKRLLKLSDGTVIDEERFNAGRDLFEVMGLSVVAERESRGYKVTQRIMTGAEVLEENSWSGRYIPIIPVYGDEVNVEGKRYFRSLIRDAKDPQRMFNYWRTTTTELIALAPKSPFIGRKGAFDTDIDKWATANTQSHPFIEFDGPEAPQRQPFAGPPAGALQEALNASDDMKSIMGIHDASLGARSNETSGRAIMARQREGDVSTFHFIDNLSRAIRHAGRVLIDLIPLVYTGERVIRVMGQDGTPSNVRLKPGAPKEPQAGQDGAMVRLFDLSAGKYDLTVTTGPSFTTRREEAATQMMELLRGFPQAAPIIGDLVAKNLDWPGADEIADRLKTMLPPQLQGEGNDPRVQQMQQVIEQGKGALQGMKAHIDQLERDKGLEAQKIAIDAYNAETNRLKVTQAGMPPEAVQALVMQTLQQVLASPDVLPPAVPQGMPMDGPMMPPGMTMDEPDPPPMPKGGPPMPPNPMPGAMMPPQEPPQPGGFSFAPNSPTPAE